LFALWHPATLPGAVEGRTRDAVATDARTPRTAALRGAGSAGAAARGGRGNVARPWPAVGRVTLPADIAVDVGHGQQRGTRATLSADMAVNVGRERRRGTRVTLPADIAVARTPGGTAARCVAS
jgi:hypothetical protein